MKRKINLLGREEIYNYIWDDFYKPLNEKLYEFLGYRIKEWK